MTATLNNSDSVFPGPDMTNSFWNATSASRWNWEYLFIFQKKKGQFRRKQRSKEQEKHDETKSRQKNTRVSTETLLQEEFVEEHKEEDVS